MTDTLQVILKIKVRTQDVTNFPFDIVYIVPEVHKALLPRMFPYALCLPFNAELIRRIHHISVDEMSTITMTQRKDTLPDEEGPDQCKRSRAGRTPMTHLIPVEVLQSSFMLVPVLAQTHQATRNKRRKDRNPAYLLANGHRRGKHATRKGTPKIIEGNKADNEFLAFFNDAAMLFTPRGPIRPICTMCPCHLEHVQGKCSLGEQKCYESLIIQPERRPPREQLQKD